MTERFTPEHLEAWRRDRKPVSAGAQQWKLIAAGFVGNNLRLEIGLFVNCRYFSAGDGGSGAVFDYAYNSAGGFLCEGGYDEQRENDGKKINRTLRHGCYPFLNRIELVSKIIRLCSPKNQQGN